MKIISFLNSKGGVGKTTLATNLARHLYLQKCNVLLVDADPQGSIRDWHEAGDQRDIDVIAADRKATLYGLPNVLDHKQYDFVLIDTPGKVTDIMATAISISDVCLIPVCPSPYDIWASKDIVEMIQVRQQLIPGVPDCYYVLNRCIPNTKISKEVIKYIDQETAFAILGNPISQRVCFAETAKLGKTIFESDNEGARDDIFVLGNALAHLFDYGVCDDL